MKKLFLLSVLIFACGAINAFAHEPFTLVASEKKSINLHDLIEIEKTRTLGAKENSSLIFTETEIRLVVKTGPEDDMLSYRIQGVRNPNLIVPAGAVLKILFVNSDSDMRHDIRFGHIMKDFDIAVDIAETVGTERLEHAAEDETMQAQEITLKAAENGAYKYFCSVRGHAKGGMWGNIFVGVKPDAQMKMPEKNPHVHSADEDHDQMNMPMPSATPEKKPDAMPDMNIDDKSGDKSDAMAEMDHGDHKMPEMNHDDHNMKNMPGMNHGATDHGGHNMAMMKSVVDAGAPMSRESSGTAWMPDSTPMYMKMKTFADGGMLMFHGNMFFRYTDIGSRRDASVGGKGSRGRFDAPSMLMAMYSRPLSNKSQLGLRVMMSLDPFIERGYGYPLLYQSGEVFRGEAIHDRQHPHDFFSEISATYSYKVSENQSVYFYAGFPGEPALGPPTFMHRMSAMNNPDAPIGHHWQDSTHITWGVVTAGYNFGKFKMETSAFKGEEPDENRWNFDRPKLDSYSGRISFNPNKEWAFQFSYGYLKNPEPSEPDLKILRRMTASAIYNKSFSRDKNWSNSFVWGQNYGNGERSNAFLFESNYDFKKNSIFGRAELVEKSGHELALDEIDEHNLYNVGAYSVGYLREIYNDKNFNIGLGAQLTINNNPPSLVPYYGGTTHSGWQIFMRVRPSAMR